MSKQKRCVRRYRTYVAAKRRQTYRSLFFVYPDFYQSSLADARLMVEKKEPIGHFRKGRSCGCSKRKHGAPKVSNGMCKIDHRRHIIEERQNARKLAFSGGFTETFEK